MRVQVVASWRYTCGMITLPSSQVYMMLPLSNSCGMITTMCIFYLRGCVETTGNSNTVLSRRCDSCCTIHYKSDSIHAWVPICVHSTKSRFYWKPHYNPQNPSIVPSFKNMLVYRLTHRSNSQIDSTISRRLRLHMRMPCDFVVISWMSTHVIRHPKMSHVARKLYWSATNNQLICGFIHVIDRAALVVSHRQIWPVHDINLYAPSLRIMYKDACRVEVPWELLQRQHSGN